MSLIYCNSQIPVGLGMRLSLDMKAMTNFSNLSDRKKQELISYIEGSTTGDESKNRLTEVVSSLHDGTSFSQIIISLIDELYDKKEGQIRAKIRYCPSYYFIFVYRISIAANLSWITHKEQCYGTWSGLCADSGTDIIDYNIIYTKALLNKRSDKFGILLAVSVTNKHSIIHIAW